MQSPKIPSNIANSLPVKTRDDDLSADFQDDESLATDLKSILTNLNAIHNYLKNLNIGEVDPIALKRYQKILQEFYESLTNKTDEASDKLSGEITEIYNKINQQFLKFETEFPQQNSSSSTSTKLPPILEVQTPRSNDTSRQNTPNSTPADDLIITQQLKISELSGIEKDLNLKINELQETIKEIEEQKTRYQKELSFYQEQNQFLDRSNNDLRFQLESLTNELELKLKDFESIEENNKKLSQENQSIESKNKELTEKFAREIVNIRSSLNQALDRARLVEIEKMELQKQISEYQVNTDKLKKQIQELEQTQHELELEKTLKENPIGSLFSQIYSQSDCSSKDDGDRIYLEGDQLQSSSVIGDLETQGDRFDKSDFPSENISQTSGDYFRKIPNDLDNPIYLSNKPTPSQPDSGSNETKILTLSSRPSLHSDSTKSNINGNFSLKTYTGQESTPTLPISTLTSKHDNPTTTAVATLGFPSSPPPELKPNNQLNQLRDSQLPSQINPLTNETEDQVNSTSSQISEKSSTASCSVTRLLPRCLTPTLS